MKIEKKSVKGKVLVGISGGVDSSCVAALLKSQGYEVEAVFLQLWKEKESKIDKALDDAKTVCLKLKIPLYIIDARAEFRKTIVNYFLDEYEKGRTPNPCVICNQALKFKLLLEKRRELKADYVATGHYALTRKSKDEKGFIYKLFRAKDEKKDQSYFLYRLTQEELKYIIFPLGDYQKEEVRKMAKEFNLPVFDKAESQDVCFVGSSALEFLQKNIKAKSGDILSENNEKVGRHKGLPFYTLGQRKGIEIGGNGPYFVIEKNKTKNILYVTNNPENKKLYKKEIVIEKVSWVGDAPNFPCKTLTQSRYHQVLSYAIIKEKKSLESGDIYSVEFSKSQKITAPGQSLVFYSEEGEVLGGGIIK